MLKGKKKNWSKDRLIQIERERERERERDRPFPNFCNYVNICFVLDCADYAVVLIADCDHLVPGVFCYQQMVKTPIPEGTLLF